MRKVFWIIFLVVVLAAVFAYRSRIQDTARQGPSVSEQQATPQESPKQPGPQTSSGQSDVGNNFLQPLYNAAERVAKKPFGIFVTQQNSPIQPERFRGYHTGADFEIFPEELNADVAVHAVCAGKLQVKEYATGYGGVAVESCELDGRPIAVVYGHLRLASINSAVGSDLKAGGIIGLLGDAYSTETGGERKHLHLGFHKGGSVNILGYVQDKAELSGWIDPCLYVCGK